MPLTATGGSVFITHEGKGTVSRPFLEFAYWELPTTILESGVACTNTSPQWEPVLAVGWRKTVEDTALISTGACCKSWSLLKSNKETEDKRPRGCDDSGNNCAGKVSVAGHR